MTYTVNVYGATDRCEILLDSKSVLITHPSMGRMEAWEFCQNLCKTLNASADKGE